MIPRVKLVNPNTKGYADLNAAIVDNYIRDAMVVYHREHEDSGKYSDYIARTGAYTTSFTLQLTHYLTDEAKHAFVIRLDGLYDKLDRCAASKSPFTCGSCETNTFSAAKINSKGKTLKDDYIKEKVEANDGWKFIDAPFIEGIKYVRYHCKGGHIREIKYDNLRKAHGCPDCNDVTKMRETTINYTKILEDMGYIVNSIARTSRSSMPPVWNISLTCTKSHVFNTTYDTVNHGGCGCPRCVNKFRNDTESILTLYNKIHENRYEYPNFVYINNYSDISVLCKIHGLFKLLAKSHLDGAGCVHCVGRNVNEEECRKIFQRILPNHKFPNVNPDWLRLSSNSRSLQLDGYCSKLKLAFEYHGEQHYHYFSDHFHRDGKHKFLEQQLRDKVKIWLCNYTKDENDQLYVTKLVVIPYYIKDKEAFIREQIGVFD